MKGKTISIHSARGGTGKTVIASNLACVLASKGYKVALLDFDFRAPSLIRIFSPALQNPVNCWINDYLNNQCSCEEILVDISKNYNFSGQLHIGLANPALNAIRTVINKTANQEIAAVKKLRPLLTTFYNDLGIDFCIFDTSPGVQYSSLNTLAYSDVCLIVTGQDEVDLLSTKDLIKDVYQALEKKTMVIVNKVLPEKIVGNQHETGHVEATLETEVISYISCYCEVLKAQRTGLLAIQNSNHPFVAKIREVADKIESV